ncbi:MAG: FAD-dependent oxidoreductase, partial [Balneolaceae bacterium]
MRGNRMKYDYDLVVIGGGAAGLTAAGIRANFGAKTMMVEADRLGGDCTWHGCIPSKTLLHASRMAQTFRRAKPFGAEAGDRPLDFAKIMHHVRRVRQEVYEEADHPDHFRDMNIDVKFGRASFRNPHTIAIAGDDSNLLASSRYFIIATGSRPVVPPIPGIDDVPHLTNRTLFELEKQPASLAIIGGGPIGIEMGQAFQRLGTEVTVIDMLPGILNNDDEELSGMLLNRLKKEGVSFKLSASVKKITQAQGKISILGERDDQPENWLADALLIATGRVANFESLNLEAANIA